MRLALPWVGRKRLLDLLQQSQCWFAGSVAISAIFHTNRVRRKLLHSLVCPDIGRSPTVISPFPSTPSDLRRPTDPKVLQNVWSVIVSVHPETFSVLVAPFEGQQAQPYQGDSYIDSRDLFYDPRGWWRHALALVMNAPPAGSGRLHRLARGISATGLPRGAGSLNDPLANIELDGASPGRSECSFTAQSRICEENRSLGRHHAWVLQWYADGHVCQQRNITPNAQPLLIGKCTLATKPLPRFLFPTALRAFPQRQIFHPIERAARTTALRPGFLGRRRRRLRLRTVLSASPSPTPRQLPPSSVGTVAPTTALLASSARKARGIPCS